MAKRGKPKLTDGTQDLVTLDECIERAKKELHRTDAPWTRRTLQNKISQGDFQRYGTYHDPQVDWNEVRKTLHWRHKVS